MTADTTDNTLIDRLADVQRAAAAVDAARWELEKALADARDAGAALRPIAAAAGLSPEWVRRLLAARD